MEVRVTGVNNDWQARRTHRGKLAVRFDAFMNECHDPGTGKFCEAPGGLKNEDVPVEPWVRKLSNEKLTYEWKFAYGEDDGFGPSGISGQNTKHGMWGKVWPVYRGQGSTSLAHEGIIYYGRLQSLLMIETDHRRRGMPVPPRPNLLGANGEVHHGSEGSNWPKGTEKP